MKVMTEVCMAACSHEGHGNFEPMIYDIHWENWTSVLKTWYQWYPSPIANH